MSVVSPIVVRGLVPDSYSAQGGRTETEEWLLFLGVTRGVVWYAANFLTTDADRDINNPV